MTNDRDAAAAKLTRRMENGPPDPSNVDDEADRPEGDKSPVYANVLMGGAPASNERGADLDAEVTDSP
jgi:hypothetical protein